MSSLKLSLGGDDSDFPTTAPIINEINDIIERDEIDLVEAVWAEDRIVISFKSGRILIASGTHIEFNFNNTIF